MSYLESIILVIFGVFTAIILLNLLIAIISNAYTEIIKKTHIERKNYLFLKSKSIEYIL